MSAGIAKDERIGKPYGYDRMQQLVKRIRVAVGLPEGMTISGFRHGGISADPVLR